MKLWIILYLVLILNISCQSVGTVKDLTSKSVNTEMESKTPVSKNSIKQPKSSNSKDPARISKNHKPGDPKS
jgi:hypothetical protein